MTTKQFTNLLKYPWCTTLSHSHGTPCTEAERLVTTANVTPKTTNSHSLLPNTASNDIQQHVHSANSGDVDSFVFGSGSLIFGKISA
jgi:hypothetical protein